MVTESITPLCPRDGSGLEVRGWRDSFYGFCTGCHGIRIERSSLERLARSGSRPPLTRVDGMADDVEIVEGTALCSCRGQPLMQRVTRDDLHLDVCPRCGAFWFDAGEMQCYLATRATPQAMRLEGTGGAPNRQDGPGFRSAETALDILGGFLEMFFY
jgi:Zn-finger nucleic acid-binding protein